MIEISDTSRRASRLPEGKEALEMSETEGQLPGKEKFPLYQETKRGVWQIRYA
jgi:hypothetical protein